MPVDEPAHDRPTPGVLAACDRQAAADRWAYETPEGQVAVRRAQLEHLVQQPIAPLKFPTHDENLAVAIFHSLYNRDIHAAAEGDAGPSAQKLARALLWRSAPNHGLPARETPEVREADVLIAEYLQWPIVGEWDRFRRDIAERFSAFFQLYIDLQPDPRQAWQQAASSVRFAVLSSRWLTPVLHGLARDVPGFDHLFLPPIRDDAYWNSRQAALLWQNLATERSLTKAAERAADKFNAEAAEHNAVGRAAGVPFDAVFPVLSGTLRRTDRGRPLADRLPDHRVATTTALHLDRAWRSALQQAPAGLNLCFSESPQPQRAAGDVRACEGA
jgi:hypothetical protein